MTLPPGNLAYSPTSMSAPSHSASSAEVIAEQAGLTRLGTRPRMGPYLRDLWSRRQYAVYSSVGSLESENMDTLLGNVWHLLNPALLIGVYFIIFGVLLDTRRGVDNFILFLTIGVFVFRYTTKSVTSGARSLVSNEGLIRTLWFPRALLPISAVLTQFLSFLPEILIIFAVALLTGQEPLLTWLLLPLFVLVQSALNLGGALIAARTNSSFRDFVNILPFAFRLLFYASGVLFSVERFVTNETWIKLFELNPMYSMISLYRWAIMAEPATSTMVLSVGLWSTILLLFGTQFFLRVEHRYGST